VKPQSVEGIGPPKLLFEAAHKAGEAGEPALAIQLYARLLSRYPQTAFADQARAAVEAQKKKLAKA
jgi:outer membrane protein assembly factor BamD (BamD/ComL family)